MCIKNEHTHVSEKVEMFFRADSVFFAFHKSQKFVGLEHVPTVGCYAMPAIG
jgi:hypothetical protein